jgi:2-iminobutanoate/2-iminopropanoate deaminase
MPSPQPVQTDAAPAPISLFSQAQVYNGLVYCSGNIGIDPKTGKLVEGTVTDRTVSKRFCISNEHCKTLTRLSQEQTIRNISALLEAANSSLKRIIKVNVYLTTMDNFGPMNEGYAKFFSAPFPVSKLLSQIKYLVANVL